MRYSSPMRGNEIRFCLLNFHHQVCRGKLEDKEIFGHRIKIHIQGESKKSDDCDMYNRNVIPCGV